MISLVLAAVLVACGSATTVTMGAEKKNRKASKIVLTTSGSIFNYEVVSHDVW